MAAGRIEGGRLYTLDAMRGLAAIAVAVSHVDPIVPAGHLAVDFFFALSGLVLGLAYQDRLVRGMSVGAFARLRVVRLWPLYALGSAIGLITIVAPVASSLGAVWRPAETLVAVLTAATMLPNPSAELLFPANPPAWSLLFELVVNIVFAVWLVRLRTRWLVMVALMGLAGFVVAAVMAGGSNLGWGWPQLPGGMARVAFAFTVGVVLARIDPRAVRRVSWMALVPVALLLVPLLSSTRVASDLATIALVAPLAVLLGARFELPTRLTRAGAWLGDLSYPLYALHFPLLVPCHRVATALGLSGAAETMFFLAVAIGCARLAIPLDAEIRRALTRPRAAIGQCAHERS